MWERKTDNAKLNGKVLHILSTTLDGGIRLHVAEMPYLDEPHIKVMGAKSRTISIEVVFVGVNSLVDSNALITELENNPECVLEHPYLGELTLVFETYSQKFSTKKGLVTLSLKFRKQGVPVALTRIDEKSASELVTNVIEESNKQFIDDVAQASPEQIDAMKFDFTTVIHALRNIANRATQTSSTQTSLLRQIEDGFTTIENLKSAPQALSEHFNRIVESLQGVLDSNQESNSEQAIKALSQTINPDAESAHCNTYITTAVVSLSEDLNQLSHLDDVDVSTFSTKSLNKVQQNIAVIQSLLSDRVDDVSKAATFESLVLVDTVEALRENVNEQANKLTQYKQALSVVEVISARPLLCIAQSNECSGEALSRLNSIKHPLFVIGSLQVEHV